MASIQELLQQARQQGIQAETPTSEVQRLLALARGTQPAAPDTTEQSYASRVMENIPSSIGKRFDEFGGFLSALGQSGPENVVKDVMGMGPPTLVGNLGRTAVGAAEEMGSMFTPFVPESNERQMFRNAVEGEAEGFTKEGFAEDPTRAPSLLAALVPGGGATRLGRFGRALGQSMDPVVGVTRAVGAGAQLLPKTIPAVNKLIGAMLGVTTGAGEARGSALVEAGRSGRADEAIAAIKGPDSPNRIGEDVIRSFNNELGGVSQNKSRFLDEAGDVDISDLRGEILGDVANGGEGGLLADMRIKVVQDEAGNISLDVPANFRNVDEGRLEMAIEDLISSPDQITVRELDEIMQGLGTISLPKTARRARTAVGSIRAKIREKLSGVEGFDAVQEPIRDFFSANSPRSNVATQRDIPMGMEPTSERLGLPGLIDNPGAPANRQRTGESMARAFNKGDGQLDRLEAMQSIESRAPGTTARSAGVGFQGWTPSEIVGRSQFFSALSPLLGAGLVTGAAASGGFVAALLALPAVSVAFIPRYAGQALVKLGKAEKGADQLASVARAAVDNAQAMGINPRNMTLGQLLERMERENQPSILGAIGGASR